MINLKSSYIEWMFPSIGEKYAFFDIVKLGDKQRLNREKKDLYGQIQSKKVYDFFKSKAKHSSNDFKIKISFHTKKNSESLNTDNFEVFCNFTGRKTYIYLLPLLEHIFYYDFYNWDDIKTNKTKLRFIHHQSDEFLLEFVNNNEPSILMDMPRVSIINDAEKQIFKIVDTQFIKTKSDLKKMILNMNPFDFEKLIGVYFKKMGYYNVKVTKKSKDGGIDVSAIARFGLNETKVVIQTKRYRSKNIDVKTVRAVRGALPEHEAQQGIIITTSDFTSDAREVASSIQPIIHLISGDLLLNHLIDKGIGIKKTIYEMILVDKDIFELI